MPIFLTKKVLWNTAADGKRNRAPWTWRGPGLVFDRTDHGHGGVFGCREVSEQDAVFLRTTPEFVNGVVFDPPQPEPTNAQRRREKRAVTEREQARDDAALEARVRGWVRDEMAKVANGPGESVVRPGAVPGGVPDGLRRYQLARYAAKTG